MGEASHIRTTLSVSPTETDEDIEAVIGRLLFISKIGVGDKISMKDMSICSNTMLYKFIRSFFGDKDDTKDGTLTFIREVIYDALNKISDCRLSGDFRITYVPVLVDAINKSRKGIVNLTKTYSQNANFVSNIEALVTLLDMKLRMVS